MMIKRFRSECLAEKYVVESCVRHKQRGLVIAGLYCVVAELGGWKELEVVEGKITLPFKMITVPGVVAHASNPSIFEGAGKRVQSSNPVWAIQ